MGNLDEKEFEFCVLEPKSAFKRRMISELDGRIETN